MGLLVNDAGQAREITKGCFMTPSHRVAPLNDPPSALTSSSGGADEHLLRSERIQVERKTFTLSLRENPRGRFLRVTEDVGGRRDTIIIPAPGLEEFRAALDEIIQTAGETPPKAE